METLEDFIPGKLYRLNAAQSDGFSEPLHWFNKKQTVLVLDVEYDATITRVATFLTENGTVRKLTYSYGCLFLRRAVLLP